MSYITNVENLLKINNEELQVIIHKDKKNKLYIDLEKRIENFNHRFFLNIEGKEKIDFHNCDLGTLDLSNSNIETELIFSHCNINRIILNDSVVGKPITFIGIYNTNRELIDIRVYNTKLYSSIGITYLNEKNKLALSVNEITGIENNKLHNEQDFFLANTQIEYLKVENCLFNKGFWFEKCIGKKIEIDSKYIDLLRFSDCKFDYINVRYGYINSVIIFDLKTTNTIIGHVRSYDDKSNKNTNFPSIEMLRIVNEEPFKIYIERGFIKHIDIEGIIHKESTLILKKLNLWYLSLKYINYGNVYFQGFQVISSNSFKNNNYKKSYLRIEAADLGKTNFTFCDLDKFQRFSLLGSKISDTFFAGSKFPQQLSYYDNFRCVYKNTFSQQLKVGIQVFIRFFYIASEKRVSYSQLKKLFENRGDNIQATNYYSKEMDSYAISLLPKFYLHVPELINIALSKITSNHGKSWMQALLMTLLTSFCLFYSYTLCFGDNLFVNSKSMSFYLEFINPIHKADYIAEKLYPNVKINDNARWIEGFSRIVISFLLYQLVQAFRKNGRKSN